MANQTTPFSTVIPTTLHNRLRRLAKKNDARLKTMTATALREYADREEAKAV